MTRPPIPGEPYRIIASQRTRVLDHLLALDDDDRYGRFATSLSDTGIAAYVGRIDFERDIGLAVAAVDEPVIGFVHLAVHGDSAELGASVSAPWRKQGVARLLFEATVETARMLEIREIHLATAHPVARYIFAKLGLSCLRNETYPRGIVVLAPKADIHAVSFSATATTDSAPGAGIR